VFFFFFFYATINSFIFKNGMQLIGCHGSFFTFLQFGTLHFHVFKL